MRINNLSLKNIGPFKNESIEFIKDGENSQNPPVCIITGDNGSGKSIILDAIRYLFWGSWAIEMRERNIVADVNDFYLNMSLSIPNKSKTEHILLGSNELDGEKALKLLDDGYVFASHFSGNLQYDPLWFFDYWTSKLSNDSFSLNNITSPNVKQYLHKSLTGIHLNNNLSQTICFFDYLKGSDSNDEKLIGEEVFEAVKKVIEISVSNGKLSHVSRINHQVIVNVNGKDLTLDKLSSGNLYILQRLMSLIFKAYSVIILNRETSPYSTLFEVPGVLLIDEVENHLHPKWQKTLLKNIVELFPKLQVIVTTHSPFIISSVTNANIYVCKSDQEGGKIVDETDVYSNKPIDEILTSELFNTLPFNIDISNLITRRSSAIKERNKVEQMRIEKELVSINPQYFSYFNLDEQMKTLYKDK